MKTARSNWSLKLRAWVQRDVRKVLGPGRFELLGHIEKHLSISAAAKQMGMSYRRAWELVNDMNAAAGYPLVEVTTGGVRRGGARLTSQGKNAIWAYPQIVDSLEKLEC